MVTPLRPEPKPVTPAQFDYLVETLRQFILYQYDMQFNLGHSVSIQSLVQRCEEIQRQRKDA